MTKVIVALIGVTALTGCGMAFGGATGDGFTMSGTAEGLRAFYDGNNGLITNARTQDPEGNSAHWQMRAVQEQEQTKRKCANCGFLGKLFSKEQPQRGS
jgi:hypothetical protein